MQGLKLIEITKMAMAGLEQISETSAGIRPLPDKWSNKEVLGHLIDSAVVNYSRFVEAEVNMDLVFSTYDQEKWVIRRNYADVKWSEIIKIWFDINSHLAGLIGNIPSGVKTTRHEVHNFDRVAWKTVPQDQPITLDYFIWDYIGHLEHHISQILPDYKPEVIGTY